jgi:uncharacterized protein YcfL
MKTLTFLTVCAAFLFAGCAGSSAPKAQEEEAPIIEEIAPIEEEVLAQDSLVVEVVVEEAVE